jgi:glycosyltransferase involved in cell wall biosynthesis
MMKKKIAIIHYSYPPTIGGVEFIIKGHASVLARHGHRVRIITGTGESNEKNVRICLVKGVATTGAEVKAVQDELSRGLVSPGFEKLKRRLRREIREALAGVQVCFIHNVLTMHFNLALTAALLELIPKLSSKIKFYAWCHDATVFNPDYSLPGVTRYPWKIITEAHGGLHYVAISKYRQRELGRLFRVSPSSIRVVPDGMNVKTFLGIRDAIWNLAYDLDLFSQNLVLFYPSRILRRKNYELALSVLRALRKNERKTMLIMTGAPDPHNPASALYWRELRRLIEKLGLRKNVVLLHDLGKKYGKGFHIGYAELKNLYDLSDLLFISSRQEGFGIPLLEAGAKKLPIACSDIPPFRELAPGRALFFKLSEKPEAIARKIDRTMRRQTAHSMFKEIMRSYSWEAIYNKYLMRLVR